ncbi:hypothetical protein H109_00223 [Trichophyton interdigitale MR816]|uniref:Uncharacterized protein n=1 Tax=Trichophyton interdigitale (strain MR816) TaxID=1215338 RepID=A0A059JJP0_TRIIM|nr:hypothetical protein H101_01971 [Trichophyton interdigitale H6]KDB28080.1 hypothetical protein H109_00223 [Trichophyton interdigitale MR816]
MSLTLIGHIQPQPQTDAEISAMPNPRANGDGVMHNLVVCGAVDAQSPIDAAIFSDFMGISMTLELAAEGAEITALSCFPLDEHFNFLETRAPPIATIKWGILGTNQTPLFTYSKTQWVTRSNKWFEYVSPEDILKRVTAWLQDKAHSVAENDVVNIFFEAHGIMNGKICLGSKYLETSKVTSLLSQFPTSCQVNVVGRHCYSGRFCNVIKADGQILRHAIADCGLGEAVHFAATRSVSNRIRYLRSSLPFVRSLAHVSFPWLPPKVHLPVPTAEHQTILREAIRRITPSLAQDCQAETYASSLLPEVRASVTLLEELVLRDHVDVMFLKQTVHRRRRSEWPTLDPQLMQQMQREISPPSSSLLRRIQDHIHAAAAECDFDNALMDDGPIVGRLEYPNTPYDEILRALYYRGRAQSAVWDIFLILCERGFLNLEASLEHPVNFYSTPESLCNVLCLLLCFKEPYEVEACAPNNFNTSLTTPIQWLAVMISRGCAEPQRLLETIHYTQILGPLLESEVNKLLHANNGPISFECDPKMVAGYSPSPFGFWLPSGVGNDPSLIPDIIIERLAFFNKTEALFKELLRLGDAELLLERQRFAIGQG